MKNAPSFQIRKRCGSSAQVFTTDVHTTHTYVMVATSCINFHPTAGKGAVMCIIYDDAEGTYSRNATATQIPVVSGSREPSYSHTGWMYFTGENRYGVGVVTKGESKQDI